VISNTGLDGLSTLEKVSLCFLGEMMNVKPFWVFIGPALILGACIAGDDSSHDHSHDKAAVEANHDHYSAEGEHAPYGHASAQYVCNGRELLTRYTKTETVLTYDGTEINMNRVETKDSITYTGKLDGVSVKFNGEGYDSTLQIEDEVYACEKIACVPLHLPF